MSACEDCGVDHEAFDNGDVSVREALDTMLFTVTGGAPDTDQYYHLARCIVEVDGSAERLDTVEEHMAEFGLDLDTVRYLAATQANEAMEHFIKVLKSGSMNDFNASLQVLWVHGLTVGIRAGKDLPQP